MTVIANKHQYKTAAYRPAKDNHCPFNECRVFTNSNGATCNLAAVVLFSVNVAAEEDCTDKANNLWGRKR